MLPMLEELTRASSEGVIPGGGQLDIVMADNVDVTVSMPS